MCGIASLINVNPENRELAKRIFKSILLANESRGSDSTGVLSIERESNQFSLFKDTLRASEFLKRRKFRQVEGDVWIGHTRQATTGSVNIRNAHPLQRKDIFLVHNGMISNHRDIAKSLELEYEVDSEVLIPIVEKGDWDLLVDVKGSFNFIAWDKPNEKIIVERHDNPLYCLTLKELNMVMFSSIRDVLQFIAGHYGDGSGVFEFTEDTIVELDMKGNVIGEPKKLEFPEILLPSTQVVNKVYSSYSDERYPSYYSDDDDESDIDEYMRIYKDNKDEDLFCEGCGCEIEPDEKEMGIKEWGFGLCYQCLGELAVAEECIKHGEPIDLKDKQWNKFSHILEYYLP